MFRPANRPDRPGIILFTQGPRSQDNLVLPTKIPRPFYLSKSSNMSSASLTGLSRKVTDYATWQPFLYTCVIQLCSLSMIRRGAAMVLPKNSSTFAFAPFTAFQFAYSGSEVTKQLATLGGFARTVLTILTLVNFIRIGATAVNYGILASVGLKASGQAQQNPVANANLLPFVAGAIHLLENAMFLLTITTGSSFFAWLAGFLALFRDIAGTATLCLVAAVVPVFLYQWARGIGRDGRQKVVIPNPTKKSN
ncbi:hypothetical protein DFS34DRAFT_619405 [Phlyctochytrium arcticum]|nr:hypothetical protein DFS34DRAFT_619405 [Phlyctochytrium arcticum]